MDKTDFVSNSKEIEELGTKLLIKETRRIYKNKSSDEYKCKGDVKKSPIYDEIKQKLYEDFPKIKGLPNDDIKILRDMLTMLEKPIWSKMIAEFMVKPDEKNTIYAIYWTGCYRTLYGEIGLITACTEATEDGLVFRGDKVNKTHTLNMKMMRRFVKDPEAVINKSIESAKKLANGKSADQITQEAATIEGMGGLAETVVSLIEHTLGKIADTFKSALALNPIAFLSAVLSRSYDKKVAKCKKFEDLYNEAVKAYDDYKKIPSHKRKERIEHKYRKLIEKYNIKRENLLKEIEHYDKRAHEFDEDDDDDYDVKKKEETKEEKKEEESKSSDSLYGSSSSTSTSTSSSGDSDFDF